MICIHPKVKKKKKHFNHQSWVKVKRENVTGKKGKCYKYSSFSSKAGFIFWIHSIHQGFLLPSLLKTLMALTSIRAPRGSPAPPAPVLLLTLGLAMVSLWWPLALVLVVTLLSWVSAGLGDAPLACCVAGILPNLWSTLRLVGAMPLEEEEEEVGVSEGGNLNFPPRRRRVVGPAFLRGSVFWEERGLLRTPAYWRTEPSSSLSSSFPGVLTDVGLISPFSALSRRLNTPVGCEKSAF